MSSTNAALIMLAFAAGVSTVILMLGYGARSALQNRQAMMRRIAAKSRPIMGAVFLATGLALCLATTAEAARFETTVQGTVQESTGTARNNFGITPGTSATFTLAVETTSIGTSAAPAGTTATAAARHVETSSFFI